MNYFPDVTTQWNMGNLRGCVGVSGVGIGFRQDNYWGGTKQSLRHQKGTLTGPGQKYTERDVGGSVVGVLQRISYEDRSGWSGVRFLRGWNTNWWNATGLETKIGGRSQTKVYRGKSRG